MKPASIRALEMALEREAFGQHLRRLRQQRALSQEAAAHEIGCSVKSLQNWEGGVATPNPGSMRLLARFYGEPLGTLTSYIPDYRREAPPTDRLERVEAMLERSDRKLDQILSELRLRDEQELGAAVDDLGRTADQDAGEGDEGHRRSGHAD